MKKVIKKVKELSALIIFERYLWLVIKTLGGFVIMILSVYFFIGSPGHIDGPSMEPTFFDGDQFFVNRITYFLEKPKRYDIIQFINKDKTGHVIKRIIGLPGEVVTIKQGKVFVQSNREFLDRREVLPLNEVYLPETSFTQPYGAVSTTVYVVKPQQYFVLGDNRKESVDSRAYGLVPRTRIVGRVRAEADL